MTASTTEFDNHGQCYSRLRVYALRVAPITIPLLPFSRDAGLQSNRKLSHVTQQIRFGTDVAHDSLRQLTLIHSHLSNDDPTIENAGRSHY